MNKTIQDKLEAGREYRTLEVRAAEGADGWDVEGLFTTFEQPFLLYKIDNYEIWEVVDRHALDKTDKSDVIMQYDHEGRVFARVSNNTLEIGDSDEGGTMRAKLSGTEIGRQLLEEIKGGYTTKMSYGFTVRKDQRTEEEQENGIVKVTRRILDIAKLYDVSAVSLPANDATSISARAYSEGVIAEAREEIAKAEKRKKTIAIIKLLSEK